MKRSVVICDVNIMHTIHKQKIELLLTMETMIKMIEAGDSLTDDNYIDLSECFLAFNLPNENIIFKYINECRNGENKLIEIRSFFNKFYNIHFKSASNSSTISEDFIDGKYGCDREFINHVNYINSTSVKNMYDDVYNKLVKLNIDNPNYYKLITVDSRGWYMGDNWLDGVNGSNNSLIKNRVSTLKTYINDIIWLYDNLSDSISRQSLNALIKYWLTWDYVDWKKIARYTCDVVDTDVFPFYDDEIFVDCGAYTGDTVMQYINLVNDNYKRIYAYDISSTHINVMKQNLYKYNNIEIRHKGTGDIKSEMTMVGTANVFSGNKLTSNDSHPHGVEKVDVVRLDDDITEPITFLKIDVEGMDKETLMGAKKSIRLYHPKLSVDAYHKLEDIVQVPKLIHEIDNSYILFLRLPLISDAHIRFPFPTIMAL